MSDRDGRDDVDDTEGRDDRTDATDDHVDRADERADATDERSDSTADRADRADDHAGGTDDRLDGDDRTDGTDDRVDRTDDHLGGDDNRADRDDNRADGDDDGISSGVAVLVSALVALAVTAVAYWWVGGWAGNGIFVEELSRVSPTVADGGVGADWVAGNTVPLLDALIAIVHAADVLMGVMILGMVFLHWAIFRRLGDRMQSPVDSRTRETVATDGGASREDPERADGSMRGEGSKRADGNAERPNDSTEIPDGGRTDEARGGDRS